MSMRYTLNSPGTAVRSRRASRMTTSRSEDRVRLTAMFLCLSPITVLTSPFAPPSSISSMKVSMSSLSPSTMGNHSSVEIFMMV